MGNPPGTGAAGHAAGDAADRLAVESEVVVGRMSRWNGAGWHVPVGGTTRAELVFGLVQRLADLAADAERRDRRSVPWLEPGILPDQLAVMVHDLLATRSPATHRAGLAALREARAALFGRAAG